MGQGRESQPQFPLSAYRVLGADHDVFSSLFAYTYAQGYNVIVNGQADSVAGGFVSGHYFSGLGVPPAAGRLLGGPDDRTAPLPLWSSPTNTGSGASRAMRL